MKRCCHCKKIKSLQEFGVDKNCKDGLKKTCKHCLSSAYKAYHQSHPDKGLERMRRWRQDPKNQEKNRRWASQYYKNNQEKENAKHKEYRRTHDEYRRRGNESAKAYYKTWVKTPIGKILHKLSMAKSKSKRRFQNKQVTNDFSNKDLELLMKVQDGKCAKCMRTFSDDVPYTLDHILPLSKGGGLTLHNVQLLCRPCNSSKKDKFILYRKPIQ